MLKGLVNMEEENKNLGSQKSSFKTFFVIIALVLIAAGAAGTYFFYTKYQKANKLLSDPNAASKAQTETVIAKVKKLMVLPEGEDASLATVLDASKLSDQAFFKNAKNGDSVLIYTKSKIAILYRTSENIIVAVAPVSIGDNGQTQDLTIKVAILNGTTTAGITRTAESMIKAQFPKSTFTAEANAAKNDYPSSIVVDLTGKNTSIANALGSTVGATLGDLPSGEVAPSGTDFLIILGANFQSK